MKQGKRPGRGWWWALMAVTGAAAVGYGAVVSVLAGMERLTSRHREDEQPDVYPGLISNASEFGAWSED
jgi:hypothetical protein